MHILNSNNRKVILVDNLHPEDGAMVQALYARSAESAEVHINKVLATGSGKFMEKYYVGYGHKSIADCGTTTLFIEGVSMLAAKAIQDWPLYCGQETSTRAMDMSKQKIIDPIGTDESKAILDSLMNFYISSHSRTAEEVKKRYPRKSDESPETYENAVKSRVFDILRGFLPAGITTQLSWHTNLRQAGDHLVLLAKHPLNEVREIAANLRTVLSEQYKSSAQGMSLPSLSGVAATDGSEARDVWNEKIAYEFTYPISTFAIRNELIYKSSIDPQDLENVQHILDSRPRGSVLPHFLTDLGQFSFLFPLDFGSFRDIQRHRNGVCRMPLLTESLGFEQWYLDQLDPELQTTAKKLLTDLHKNTKKLTSDAIISQCYIPMGYRIPCSVTYGLPATVYVLELRSTKTVHPTLRRAVHKMIEAFKLHLPNVPLHVDTDVDDWTVRRGAQTIIAK
jgi:thymidylate synthase ThyX